ncbi:MAG: GAF domain-containing protein, partial [Burkholderiales bacterium]|nr:GAF domain-containing protein [Burkholderiales bacterium]
MTPDLETIRASLDGAIPAVMATCSTDGVPNVSYLSDVLKLDGPHIALSYQFFNKTRQNVLANPHARLIVVNPQTAAIHRLEIEYLRTETAGPVFERMKAKLAGIASHTGMDGVFKLLGADIYRVHAVEQVPGKPLPPVPARVNLLSALRRTSERLAACTDLDALLDELLGALDQYFGISQAMVLMLDPSREVLYTVASRGYARSGIGSEIPVGAGVIGVAARENTPIRIGYMTQEYAYSRAMRDAASAAGLTGRIATEIPFPGLEHPGSQMAVPFGAFGRQLGVLYVESEESRRFSYDEEDILVAVAGRLGLVAHLQQLEGTEEGETAGDRPAPDGGAVELRRHAADDSVFLDDDYLIKGVAGAILWKLATAFSKTGRTDFSNRELRLDPALGLPDVDDNLEARLILLRRRLEERGACLRIERTGRGRFRLVARRPLQLREVGGGGAPPPPPHPSQTNMQRRGVVGPRARDTHPPRP